VIHTCSLLYLSYSHSICSGGDVSLPPTKAPTATVPFDESEAQQVPSTESPMTSPVSTDTSSTTTYPITGGVVPNSLHQNTPEGDAKLLVSLEEAETSPIPEAGTREIGSFDCAGMTGKLECMKYV